VNRSSWFGTLDADSHCSPAGGRPLHARPAAAGRQRRPAAAFSLASSIWPPIP